MSNHLSDELQEQYEDFRMLARRATKETLDQPDWELNTQCVNIVKAVTDQALLLEMTQMLRRRLRETNLRVVVLTMYLIDAIAHNCGHSLLCAFNDEQFMQQIGAVARKYFITPSQAASPHTVPNYESRQEAVSVCLELLYNWSEFFRPRRQYYGNIVDMYEILDSEGISMPASELHDAGHAEQRTHPESPPIADQNQRSFHTSRTQSDNTTSAATSSSHLDRFEILRTDSAPIASTAASAQAQRNQPGADLTDTGRPSNGTSAKSNRSRSVDQVQMASEFPQSLPRSSRHHVDERSRSRDASGTATYKAAQASEYERAIQLSSKGGTIPLLPFSQIDPCRASADSFENPAVDRKVLDVTLSRYHSPKLDTWGLADNVESKSDASSSTCLSRPEKAAQQIQQTVHNADTKDRNNVNRSKDDASPRSAKQKSPLKVESKSLSMDNDDNFGVGGAEYLDDAGAEEPYIPPALKRQISPAQPAQRALDDFLKNCHGALQDADMQDELLQQVEIERRIQEGLSRKDNGRNNSTEARSLVPADVAKLALKSTDSGNALQHELMHQVEIERSIKEQLQRQNNLQAQQQLQQHQQMMQQQGMHYNDIYRSQLQQQQHQQLMLQQQAANGFAAMPGGYQQVQSSHFHSQQQYSHEMQLQLEIEAQQREEEAQKNRKKNKPKKPSNSQSGDDSDSSDSSIGYDGKLIDFADGNNKDFFKVGHTNTYIDTDTPRDLRDGYSPQQLQQLQGQGGSGTVNPLMLLDQAALTESHMFRQNRPDQFFVNPATNLLPLASGKDYYTLEQQQELLQQQYGYPQHALPYYTKASLAAGSTISNINASASTHNATTHSRTSSGTSTNILSSQSHTHTTNSREIPAVLPADMDMDHQQIELQKLIFSEYEHKKRSHNTKVDAANEVNEAKERLLRQQQESLLACTSNSTFTPAPAPKSRHHQHSGAHQKKHDNTRAVDLLTRKSTAEMIRYATAADNAAATPGTPVSLRGYSRERGSRRNTTDSPVLDTTASISAANAKSREREKREQREREIEIEWEREQERAMELEKERERAQESERQKKKASAEPRARRSKATDNIDGGEVAMKRDWLHRYEDSPAPEIVVRGGSAVSDLTCSSISSGSETLPSKEQGRTKERDDTFFEPIHAPVTPGASSAKEAPPAQEDPLLQSVAQMLREALDTSQPGPALPPSSTATEQNSPLSAAQMNIFNTSTKAGTIDRAKALTAARLLIATLMGDAAQPEGEGFSQTGSTHSKSLPPQASPGSAHTDFTQGQTHLQTYTTETVKESRTLTDTSYATELVTSKGGSGFQPASAHALKTSDTFYSNRETAVVANVSLDEEAAFNQHMRSQASRKPELSVLIPSNGYTDSPEPPEKRAPRKMESYDATPAKRNIAVPVPVPAPALAPAEPVAATAAAVDSYTSTPPVSPVKRENGGRPPHARTRSNSSQFRMLQSEKVLQALEEVSQANERYVPEVALQTSDESLKGARDRGSADSIMSSPRSSPDKEMLQPPMRGMPPSRLAISTVAMQSGISVITEDSFESAHKERSRSRSRLPRGAVARSSSIAAEERAGRTEARNYSSRIPRSASVDAQPRKAPWGTDYAPGRTAAQDGILFAQLGTSPLDNGHNQQYSNGFESMDSQDSSPFVPTKQLPRDDAPSPLPAAQAPVPAPVAATSSQQVQQLQQQVAYEQTQPQATIPEPQHSPKGQLSPKGQQFTGYGEPSASPMYGSQQPSPSSNKMERKPSFHSADNNSLGQRSQQQFDQPVPAAHTRENSWDSTREMASINRDVSRETAQEWPTVSPTTLEEPIRARGSHRSASQPPPEDRRRESRESRHYQDDAVVVRAAQDDRRQSRRIEPEEPSSSKGHRRSPSRSSQPEERSNKYGEHRSSSRLKERSAVEVTREEYRSEERHSSKSHHHRSSSRGRLSDGPPSDPRRQSVDPDDRRRSSSRRHEREEHSPSKGHQRSSSRGSELTSSRSPKVDPRYEPAIPVDERRQSRRMEPEGPSHHHHRSSSRGSELTSSKSPKVDPRYDPAVVEDERRQSRRVEPDSSSPSKHRRSSSRGGEALDSRSQRTDRTDLRYEAAVMVDDRRSSRRTDDFSAPVSTSSRTRDHSRSDSFSTEVTEQTRRSGRPPMEPEYRQRESSSGKHRSASYDDRPSDSRSGKYTTDPYAAEHDRRVYSIPEEQVPPAGVHRSSSSRHMEGVDPRSLGPRHSSGMDSAHVSRTMSHSQSRYITEEEARSRDPRDPRDPRESSRDPRDRDRDPRRSSSDAYGPPPVTPTYRPTGPPMHSASSTGSSRPPNDRDVRPPPMDRQALERQQLQDRRNQLARDNTETLLAGLHMSDEEMSYLSRGGPHSSSQQYRDSRDPRDPRGMGAPNSGSSKSRTMYPDDQTVATGASSHYYAQQQRIKQQERELHEQQMRGHSHLVHDGRSKSYGNLNSGPHAAFPAPPVPHAMHRSASQGTVLKPAGPPPPPAKPVGTSKPGWWSCHMCTLENPPSYLACDACGMVRGPG